MCGTHIAVVRHHVLSWRAIRLSESAFWSYLLTHLDVSIESRQEVSVQELDALDDCIPHSLEGRKASEKGKHT